MITPADAQKTLDRRFARRFTHWAVRGCAGPAAELPLHPPTQQQALAAPGEIAAWIAEWAHAEEALSEGRVVWEERRWASMGAQRLPVRLLLPTPSGLADFIGHGAQWRRAEERARRLRGVLVGDTASEDADEAEARSAVDEALSRRIKQIAALDEADAGRLTEVLGWLLAHPQSGIFPRQVPVRGVDSKWTERHQGLLSALISAATDGDLPGLRGAPGLVRARFLDARLAPGGIRELAAPADELSGLEIRPRAVMVMENLQTVLALPDLPGIVALHGAGYAVDQLAGISWVAAADVVYWGDLDVDGLRILSRLRRHVPQARSILTDHGTLEAHLDLCGPDRADAPREVPERLTAAEREAFAALAEHGGMRLEQERIPWATALAEVERACGSQ